MSETRPEKPLPPLPSSPPAPKHQRSSEVKSKQFTGSKTVFTVSKIFTKITNFLGVKFKPEMRLF